MSLMPTMIAGEEHDCKLLSSRGILKSCDVHSRNPISSVRAFPHAEYPPDWIENLRPGNSIYVCTSALPDFVVNVFPRLAASGARFVLVTGDADELMPNDIFGSVAAAAEFVSSPCILAWFAQNCTARHPKIFQLPIGLDYHTIAAGNVPWWGPQRPPTQQEAELLALRSAAPNIATPHRAYASFHLNMIARFGAERQLAMAQISPDCVYYEPRPIERLQSWRNQKLRHRFVISPAGNGLDCHRTWEALCLGCIPIVRTSPLDPLYEGLPVWIVKSWSEVTHESMAAVAAQFDARGNSAQIPEKLLLKTWTDKIRQAGAAV